MKLHNYGYAILLQNTGVEDADLSYEQFRTAVFTAYLLNEEYHVAPDAWWATCPYWGKLLMEPGGHLLAQKFLIASRQPDKSLETFFDAQQRAGRYGYAEANRPLIRAMDQMSIQRLGYDLAPIAAGFRAACDTIFDFDVLVSFGVTEAGARAFLTRLDAARLSGKVVYDATWTREETVANPSPYLSPSDAKIIWEVVGAAYAFGLPSYFDMGVIAPDNYQGHALLAKLRLRIRSSLSLQLHRGSFDARYQFQEVISDSMILWLFEVLPYLTVPDLMAAAGVESRRKYLRHRRKLLGWPSQNNFRRASASLQEFLKDAAKEVLRRGQDEDRVAQGPRAVRLLLRATNEGMQMQVEGAAQQYQIVGIIPDVTNCVESLQFVAARNDIPIIGSSHDSDPSRSSDRIILTGSSSKSSRRGGASSCLPDEDREAA